jgi:hypothetical protein
MVDCSEMQVGNSTDALFVEVYARLKAMASRRLAGQHRNGTLETTELVHELYLRMGDRSALQFEEPRQFFAYAARDAPPVDQPCARPPAVARGRPMESCHAG